jgi:hypothetical protein
LESSENITKKSKITNDTVDNSFEKKLTPLKSILKKSKDFVNVEKQYQIEQPTNGDLINDTKIHEQNHTIYESDEQILKLIKNRLTALTLLGKNLMQMDKLSQEYQLKKETLMNDFFGFSGMDEENETLEPDFDNSCNKEELFKNLDTIKLDLQNVMKKLQSKENDSNLNLSSYDSIITTVPKALMALKYKIPMLFINKLFYYLSATILESSETIENSNKNILIDRENILKSKQENDCLDDKQLLNNYKILSKDKEFYNHLLELQKKLYENRKDLSKMVAILNDLK